MSAGYLSLATNYALRTILDRQLIVIQATSRKLTNVFEGDVTRNKSHREALIEASIVTNAALAAYTAQQELHGFDPPDLRVVYGVYVLQSREVRTPAGKADGAAGLAEPPRDLASFVELGEAIAASHRIRSLITSE